MNEKKDQTFFGRVAVVRSLGKGADAQKGTIPPVNSKVILPVDTRAAYLTARAELEKQKGLGTAPKLLKRLNDAEAERTARAINVLIRPINLVLSNTRAELKRS